MLAKFAFSDISLLDSEIQGSDDFSWYILMADGSIERLSFTKERLGQLHDLLDVYGVYTLVPKYRAKQNPIIAKEMVQAIELAKADSNNPASDKMRYLQQQLKCFKVFKSFK